MRRRYSIPTYRNIRRIATAVAALCLAACASDEPAATPDDEGGNGSGTKGSEVTVVIAAPQPETRAVRTGDNAPTDENAPKGNEIRSVRIYAYEHGKTDDAPVGYLEDDYIGTGVTTYKMEVSQRGQLDFIALLNDKGARLEGNALGENSTLNDLNAYRIGRQLTETGEGGSDYAIPMSTLDGTNSTTGMSNRTFTITETTATQYVNLEATRAMSRLRLCFAKYNTGTSEVQITSATLTQGPLSTRLLTEESVESLPITDTYYDTKGTENITVVTSPVEVEAEITDPDTKLIYDEKDEARTNTTLIATAYMPENPRGATKTHGDGQYNGELDGTTDVYTQSAYKLTLSYKVGTSEVKDKVIYLPAVKRNQTVNVFGLLSGKDITLYIRVAEWKTEDVTLADYPTYSDCGLAEGRSGYSTEATFVTGVADPEKPTDAELTRQLAAAFACTFNMTAPKDHEFVPKLTGAGEARFKLRVFRDQTELPADTSWVAGRGDYTIYVIPIGPYENEAVNTVDLLITTHTWAGTADPLLINLEGKWNAGANPQDDRIRITLKKPDDDTGTSTGEEDTNT